MLATLAVFGGLVAWDNIVARGVFSRGVLLATFAFALVLPPLAESWRARCWCGAGGGGSRWWCWARAKRDARIARTLRRRAATGAEAGRVPG